MNAVQQTEGNFYDNDRKQLAFPTRSCAKRSLSWYATPSLSCSSTIPVGSMSER
jgi:hypothetical protein